MVARRYTNTTFLIPCEKSELHVADHDRSMTDARRVAQMKFLNISRRPCRTTQSIYWEYCLVVDPIIVDIRNDKFRMDLMTVLIRAVGGTKVTFVGGRF